MGKKNGIDIEVEVTKGLSDKAFRDLKRELRREASTVNKRISRLEKAGMGNIEIMNNMEMKRGGNRRFSTAGKNTPEDVRKMRNEQQQIKQFKNAKTSKVREARKFIKRTAENQGIKYDSTKEMILRGNNFWNLVGKLRQKFEEMRVDPSLTAIRAVKEYMSDNENGDPDVLDKDPEKILDAVFEHSQGGGNTARDEKNTTHMRRNFASISRRKR